MTIAEFLLARIAEDKKGWPGVVMTHRMQAECEVKRRLVELHRPSNDRPGPEFASYCEGCWEEGGKDGAPVHPCRTVRLVAQVYADHPDYDAAWATNG